jgi:ribosomal protein S15P/S13E
MSQDTHISIKEAAEISGKSVQTIRRMIKAKKLKFKKERTPQGFNYLIEADSVYEHFDVERDESAPEVTTSTNQTDIVEAVEAKVKEEDTPVAPAVAQDRSHQKIVNYEPVKEFNDTIQKIVDQHGKEKENLFKLIESFQNKVIHLETKLKDKSSKKGLFRLW